MLARKPDGTWRIGCDYQDLNGLGRPTAEPLPHIAALPDGTRGARVFNELDLAGNCHQLHGRAPDRWKTSFRTKFRSQLGRFE